ncbi:MJ0042-type zinc finger domain-containing protein [Afipia broomeae]|uniref:MJ0042 family finger-like domain-containing protein n=3 Tax=Bacteria TaxID=2 RepID=K8PNF4_9BRAD|nr:MJ0042-type zinc finger domain-containing protein [Afipia broomeae]EKS41030.1 MJ0042 family finger-like domain-containing protein [Afipia broomeae ATCC 49717]
MHIVCPHCTTSYAVDPANFSAAGRRVRCARCQEVWLAVPQELASAMSGYDVEDVPPQDGFGGQDGGSGDWHRSDVPHVESPSISSEWPQPPAAQQAVEADWTALAQQEAMTDARPAKPSRFGKLGSSLAPFLKSANWAKALPGVLTLPTACMALGAVVFALLAWRADVVRAMPQTAAFFKMIGMGVNLRGLAFEDLKISTETVNNKTVLLIEGAIIDVARRSVEIPRLRFIVRDANGADIYAWNAVLEQPVLNPGERAWFKTRLASPPAEGREIAVRFFHKRDIATGGT